MKSTRNLLIATLICSFFPAYGQTWTQTSAPSNHWSSLACSADGSKLVAVITGGGIYTSTNSGVDWMSNSVPVANWSSVASSADGSKMVALISGGVIYSSTNSGGNWLSNSAIGSGNSIASSADGSTLIVAANTIYVYVSTNSGGVFVKTNVSNSITEGVASLSADGTILMTAAPFGVDISTSAGATWVSEAGGIYMGETRGAAISAQGNAIVTKADNGVFISTNMGMVFSNVLKGIPIASDPSVAISAEGKKIFIAIGTTNLYCSINFGATWTTNNTPSTFKFITSSADGTKLASIGSNFIYTAYSPSTSFLNFTPQANNLAISWLIPSTNFVVQQSSDLISWVDLTNQPTLNLTNLNNELVLSPTNSSGFFRLSTP